MQLPAEYKNQIEHLYTIFRNHPSKFIKGSKRYGQIWYGSDPEGISMEIGTKYGATCRTTIEITHKDFIILFEKVWPFLHEDDCLWTWNGRPIEAGPLETAGAGDYPISGMITAEYDGDLEVFTEIVMLLWLSNVS